MELGVGHVGFNDGVHVVLVDFDDLVHAAEVNLNGLWARHCIPGAKACTQGLELDAMFVAEPHDSLNLLGGLG